MKKTILIGAALAAAVAGAFATSQSGSGGPSAASHGEEERVTCGTCNGTGKVKVNSEEWDTCKTCNGAGKVSK